MKINKIIEPVTNAFQLIGYKRNLIKKDYEYADFFQPNVPLRTIKLGIFGHEPTDYRSACFGFDVLDPSKPSGLVINEMKALGAPQIFLIKNGKAERWIMTETEPYRRETYKSTNLHRVVLDNKKDWGPKEIIRAKSGFIKPEAQQLDFVDVGLLQALEHEAGVKIDYLIRGILNRIEENCRVNNIQFQPTDIFHIVFRLLAAKLFKDRDLSTSPDINFNKPETALKAVDNFYRGSVSHLQPRFPLNLLTDVSQEISRSFSFSNISVDTLTYIYENTFVSPANRKALGIHSTPSYVADYVLSQIKFEDIPRSEWHVLDCTCGHAIFLIAAMRRMRDLLPVDWGRQRRHKYFAQHLHGIEIDRFSVEVANMCLMLADFPESNGWDLKRKDIFSGNALETNVRKVTVLVGNPPFENIEDRRPETPKPFELLRRALPALSDGSIIGFVLPRSILDGDDYKKIRESLLADFRILSLTTLPDRIFLHSDAETAIIVAQKTKDRNTTLYREVKDAQRYDFRIRNRFTWEDNVPQTFFKKSVSSRLIVPFLREVWEWLEHYPRLKDKADIKIGVQYEPRFVKDIKDQIIRDEPFPGSSPAILNVSSGFMQFCAKDTVHISTDKKLRRQRAQGAWRLNWESPKVVIPASRMSRGPWRYAAAIDRKNRIIGRSLYAVWSKSISVETLAALLNSPLAAAYIYSYSAQRTIAKRDYESIPVPQQLSSANEIIGLLVKSYLKALIRDEEMAKKILLQIDSEILKLYDLPPKLERRLLNIFWQAERPVPFGFKGYISPNIDSWIPLHIYISDQFRNASPDKILEHIPFINDSKFIEYLKNIGNE